MEHTFLYRASLFDEGKPLHVFLKEHHYCGKLISRLRRTPDGLQIAGKTVYTNHIMEAGEVLQVRVMEERDSSHILPVPMPLNILYEDTDLMVLNKPSNLPVHPSIGNYDNTLANGLVHYFACSGQPFTFRIINRLDRDTTGLVIIAKHSLSACILYDMAAKRMLHRTYLAVVTGHLSGSGTICAPIARTSDSVISRCVDFARGEQAVTHYEALEYQNGYTLVQVVLETGRTHQIRVHMQYIGHPIPGDFLYYPDYSVISRQALHSFGLEFPHPMTGQNLSFLAPLPSDMTSIFLS